MCNIVDVFCCATLRWASRRNCWKLVIALVRHMVLVTIVCITQLSPTCSRMLQTVNCREAAFAIWRQIRGRSATEGPRSNLARRTQEVQPVLAVTGPWTWFWLGVLRRSQFKLRSDVSSSCSMFCPACFAHQVASWWQPPSPVTSRERERERAQGKVIHVQANTPHKCKPNEQDCSFYCI